jgi:response regulator RpfG family c-di-GMP phosphodiesterase
MDPISLNMFYEELYEQSYIVNELNYANDEYDDISVMSYEASDNEDNISLPIILEDVTNNFKHELNRKIDELKEKNKKKMEKEEQITKKQMTITQKLKEENEKLKEENQKLKEENQKLRYNVTISEGGHAARAMKRNLNQRPK